MAQELWLQPLPFKSNVGCALDFCEFIGLGEAIVGMPGRGKFIKGLKKKFKGKGKGKGKGKKGKVMKPCKYGAKCVDPHCKYQHPKGGATRDIFKGPCYNIFHP